MDRTALVTLTADIVAAHVSHNNIAVGDMPTLVLGVHEALPSAVSGFSPVEESKKTALVSVRASIKPDYLVCMECGGKHKVLKRHLFSAHGMTPDQYRADYGLPASYPMVSADYSEQRRELAKNSGLGQRPEAAEPQVKTITKSKRRPRKPAEQARAEPAQGLED